MNAFFVQVWSIAMTNEGRHGRDEGFTILGHIKLGLKYFLRCRVVVAWSNLG